MPRSRTISRSPSPSGHFSVFSVIAWYWRFHLPGGRYASSLPAHVAPGERDADWLREWDAVVALERALRGPAVQRRLGTLDTMTKGAVDRHLGALREAIESSEFDRAQAAAKALEALAAPALAARRTREALGAAAAVAVAAVVALGLRAKFAQSYAVIGTSMLPTLDNGDSVAGSKFAYAEPARLPLRGDVVAFRSGAVSQGQEGLPDFFVKRVVGLPGDCIEMKNGAPVINGWEVPTCRAGPYLHLASDGTGVAFQGVVFVEFLEDRAYVTIRRSPMPEFEGSYLVKPGEVFVLGDNRENSTDSRAFNHGDGGGVPLGAIDARIGRFLIGTQPSGDADWSRLLNPIDKLPRPLRVEGVSAMELENGLAACMARRPSIAKPPLPIEARLDAPGPGPT